MAMDDGRPALAAGLRERLRERGLTRRRLRVALHPATWTGRWRRWFAERRSFWGLALGRSGTSFLADLLARAEGARVRHEPRGEDLGAWRRARSSPEAAAPYLERFALPDVYLRERDADPETYGEVNSYLRRHADALRSVLPGTRVFHLVRDGRDVVRSMYARATLTPEDEATAGLLASGELDGPAAGGEPTRFERLCRYWRDENAWLRERTECTVRLEDLVEDYGRFREELLEPLGLEVGHAAWSETVDRPANVTEEHELAPPEAWSGERARRFWEVCGEEMERYGYR